MIPPFLEYVPIFGVVSLDLVLDWNFDDDVLLHGQGYVVRVPKGNRGKNSQAEFTALEERGLAVFDLDEHGADRVVGWFGTVLDSPEIIVLLPDFGGASP